MSNNPVCSIWKTKGVLLVRCGMTLWILWMFVNDNCFSTVELFIPSRQTNYQWVTLITAFFCLQKHACSQSGTDCHCIFRSGTARKVGEGVRTIILMQLELTFKHRFVDDVFLSIHLYSLFAIIMYIYIYFIYTYTAHNYLIATPEVFGNFFLCASWVAGFESILCWRPDL